MKTVRPFLKWVGGKTQLLNQFERFYPTVLKTGRINKYIEPFVGGGAVFFHIMDTFDIEYAYISDVNKDLILAYKVIQKEPFELMNRLENYQKEHDKREKAEQKAFFIEVRKKYNFYKKAIDYESVSKLGIERTAELIYINKVCFNGLFRVNSKGEFNAPFGDYKKPKIFDPNNIEMVSKCLNKTEIKTASYEECFDLIDKKTFVYFDPPYRPISRTANFTTYSGCEFKEHEQIKLFEFFNKLHTEKKAKLMLSNSDPQNESDEDRFFDTMYEQFFVNRVSANRRINSNSEKRGHIKEVVITNYKPSPLFL